MQQLALERDLIVDQCREFSITMASIVNTQLLGYTCRSPEEKHFLLRYYERLAEFLATPMGLFCHAMEEETIVINCEFLYNCFKESDRDMFTVLLRYLPHSTQRFEYFFAPSVKIDDATKTYSLQAQYLTVIDGKFRVFHAALSLEDLFDIKKKYCQLKTGDTDRDETILKRICEEKVKNYSTTSFIKVEV